MYRLALVSDIHGNALALREVLADVERRGVDEVVCLGDVATLGVAPGEVVDTLQRLGCRCIAGNHEDYLLEPEAIDAHIGTGVLLESIDWCRDRLSPEQLDFLRGFETGIELTVEDGFRIRLFHGTPASNGVDLFPETPARELDDHLGRDRAPVMAGGHTHLQMLRPHRGTLLVNPGSVGAPFAERPEGSLPRILPHAEYAIVEVRGSHAAVTLHRLALDRDALVRAARESTIPLGDALAEVYGEG